MQRLKITNLLRKHWYDLGGFLSLVVLIYVFVNQNNLTNYDTVMWLSIGCLFLHQLEEYRIAGTFPGMVNTVMYKSTMPDRYPLNTNTAFYVNVVVGWTSYFLAAMFSEKTVWLGMATMLVSAGNVIAHTIVFNIKARTMYNAGLATSLLLFIPCIYYFIVIIQRGGLAGTEDYCIGIILGVTLNLVGIIQLIRWMADKDTHYVFDNRNLLARDRH
jgi:hypothetical protein